MILEFASEREANEVGLMLYGSLREKNQLKLINPDIAALKQAIALNDAKVTCCSDEYPLFEFYRYQRECLKEDRPRIHVSCTTAANNGKVHGMWIDAARQPTEILEDINWLLSWSPLKNEAPCQNWEIDCGDNFFATKVEEIKDLDRISKLALALAQYGKPFARFYGYFGYWESDNIDPAIAHFQKSYRGSYLRKEDFPGYGLTIDSDSENLALYRNYIYLRSCEEIYVFAE